MQLGRRTVLALLVALVCLNILIRFPRSEHEVGVDSFSIHNFAAVISEEGRIPWVLNPLGYFGWYPLSYPSAGPIVISGVSQTVGVAEEGAILLLSLAYGVLGVLVAFMMARSFREDDLFALVVAFVFSVAPRFVSFTVWSASTRNLFMVLIPIFLWALVRAYRKPGPKNLFLLVSVLVLMLATHRLTILLAVVVIAFVLAYVFILVNRVMRVRFPRILLSRTVRRWTPRSALVAILGIAAFMLVGTDVLGEYQQGQVCSGASITDEVCNLGVSITRSVGLALPFAFVGVFHVVRYRNKGFTEAFLVLSLLALIPTLFLRQYTGFYILPFVALFAAFGILAIIHIFARHRRARNAVIAISVVGIAAFSVGVLEFESEASTAITDATYNTALYLRFLPSGSFVANDGLMGVRVSSISSVQGLPVGGAGTTAQGPELLILGSYTPQEVFDREARIPLTELTIEHDSPFILEGIDVLSDWQVRVLFLDVDQVSNRTTDRYRLVYYLENDNLRGQYTAFGNIYDGAPFDNFAKSVQAKRYKLYDGDTEDLYLAFAPPES